MTQAVLTQTLARSMVDGGFATTVARPGGLAAVDRGQLDVPEAQFAMAYLKRLAEVTATRKVGPHDRALFQRLAKGPIPEPLGPSGATPRLPAQPERGVAGPSGQAAAGPIALVTGGLKAGGRALQAAEGALQQAAGQIGGDAGKTIGNLGQVAGDLGRALENLNQSLAGFDLEGVISAVGSVIAAGINAIAVLLDGAGGLLGVEALRTAGAALTTAADAVAAAFDAAAGVIGDALASAKGAITDALGAAGQAAAGLVSSLVGAAREALGAITDALGGLIDAVVSFFADLFGAGQQDQQQAKPVDGPAPASTPDAPPGDAPSNPDQPTTPTSPDPAPPPSDPTSDTGDMGTGKTGGGGPGAVPTSGSQPPTGGPVGHTSLDQITVGLLGGHVGGDPAAFSDAGGGTPTEPGTPGTAHAISGGTIEGQGARQFVKQFNVDPTPQEIAAATAAIVTQLAQH